MEISKYDLCEKRYLKHFLNSFEKIQMDGRTVLILLCRKSKDFSDNLDDSKIFLFDSLKKNSVRREAFQWAEIFSAEYCDSPNPRVKYLIAILSEDDLLLLLEGNIEDVFLKAVSVEISQRESCREKII